MDEFWKVLMKLCEAGGVSSFILEADKEIAYYHDGSLRQAPLTTPQAAVDHILNAVKRSKDVPNSDIDRSFTYEKFRFRVNAYMSRGIRKMVLRLLPVSVMEFAKLGLPSRAAERILSLDRG